MKVVIFAGGWGTRLGQIADRVPKPMVPIGGQSILRHIMNAYAWHGYKDFVLCLGVKGDAIRAYFENLPAYSRDFTIDLATGRKTLHGASEPVLDWNVTLAGTGLNTLKGGRLKKVGRYLDSEHHFLTYGDGLADVDLQALLAFHKRHGKLLTITGVHPPSRYGEMEERRGRVTAFAEKASSSQWINGGYMVFRRGLLDWLTTDDGCDFENGVVSELAGHGEVAMYRHVGPWIGMDHEQDVHELERLLADGRAFWKPWERVKETAAVSASDERAF
ncbi:MAG: glucose-1-phosphate cytidylyltransferase [Planctomycetes bacterium]|nr:glucose-1-phosphate cytidylyltransferase [Planctomycetota bacterium]